MAEKQNILENLKDYSLKPPKNAFGSVWGKIVEGKNTNDLGGPVVLATAGQEFASNEIKIFTSLQDFAIEPPDFSLLKIGANPPQQISDYSNNPKKVTPLFMYVARIAAAILIICCCAWIVHVMFKNDGANNNNSTANTNQQLNKPVVSNANPGINIKPSKNSGGKNNSTASTDKNNKHPNGIGTSPEKITFSTGHASRQLIDNDIFVTLVSYNYNQYKPYFLQVIKHGQIRLNQFSYINISDKMSEMLKSMYSTKHNNKPTRKARKMQAKLLKWKKADENNFDSNTHKNPVDIIDLSEFILK